MTGLGDNAPEVSVIVPVFNGADHVEETLRSLLGQTFRDVEIIVVDDGSTDATPAVLDRLELECARNADTRLTRIVQDNAGEAAAVNAGWARAKGALVTIVSADDPQPSGWLKACADAMRAHPNVVVGYPDWDMIDGTGEEMER